MKIAYLLVPALLATAACGKSGTGNETAGTAPAATATAPSGGTVKLKPGAWNGTSELISMEMPGVDPALLKNGIGRKTEFHNCVTPEQAERPPADFFAHPDVKNGNCTSEKFDMAGGKIDAVVVCGAREGQGEPLRMEMSGTYAADSYDMTVRMTSQDGPGSKGMTMVARSSGRHVGDSCEG